MAESRGIFSIVLVPLKGFIWPIVSIQPIFRTHPKHTFMVLENRPNDIVAQAFRIIGIVPIMSEPGGFRVVAIQPVSSADPNAAGAILKNRPNSIVTQAVGVLWIIFIMRELFGR